MEPYDPFWFGSHKERTEISGLYLIPFLAKNWSLRERCITSKLSFSLISQKIFLKVTVSTIVTCNTRYQSCCFIDLRQVLVNQDVSSINIKRNSIRGCRRKMKSILLVAVFHMNPKLRGSNSVLHVQRHLGGWMIFTFPGQRLWLNCCPCLTRFRPKSRCSPSHQILSTKYSTKFWKFNQIYYNLICEIQRKTKKTTVFYLSVKMLIFFFISYFNFKGGG